MSLLSRSFVQRHATTSQQIILQRSICCVVRPRKLTLKRAFKPRNITSYFSNSSGEQKANSRARLAKCEPLNFEAGASDAPGASQLSSAFRIVSGVVVALVTSLSLLFRPTPANADISIGVPISEDPKIFLVQQKMVEAWGIISDCFEDTAFHGRDWESDLRTALLAAFWSRDDVEAEKQLESMVDKLQDPYTRLVPAGAYRQFRVSSEGEIHGVGLLLSQDPSSQRLMVMGSLADSPAARAGVLPGDEVVTIDGFASFEGEAGAAALLRGAAGSSVDVVFAHQDPTKLGLATADGAPEHMPLRHVILRRERLQVNPVFSTAFRHNSAAGPEVTGYIRLVNFNMHAAMDVKHAITELQGQGAHHLILDLRHNPGGLVRGSVDIARLFLDSSTEAPAAIFTVAGRGPGTQQVFHRVAIDDSRAVTKAPLAILLDGQSASAAEILAGALRDNGHRAVLIGNSRTFGKGKIQNVFELSDGSALFVTVARYKTPALSEIDEVGLPPELLCQSPELPLATAHESSNSGKGSSSAASAGAPMQPLSKEERRSLPSDVAGGLALQMVSSEGLHNDACILTAERWLDNRPDWKQPDTVADSPYIIIDRAT